MKRIINSILDNDLYKFTCQNAALELFPDAEVEYRFKNRGDQRFNQRFVDELKNQIQMMKSLYLKEDEYQWLKEKCPYLTLGYMEFLKNFRFDPKAISTELTSDNNLELVIKGKWVDAALWEVPIMATISEIYFRIYDTNWNNIGQSDVAYKKAGTLSFLNCKFVEFGTRRRRSFYAQDIVINNFVEYAKLNNNSTFLGTSNCYFAKKYGLNIFGTYPHEFVQAMQALEGIANCNYFAMHNWMKIFPNGQLSTALTDTIGTNAFLKDYKNTKFLDFFLSIRQDSGDVFRFADKIIDFFNEAKIDPKSRTIVFSDSLNVEKCIEIKKYCERKINCSFGVGTHFTNNFANSPPLNIVVKLWSVNGTPVVKLSDCEGKENGEKLQIEKVKKIIKNYKYSHLQPL